MQGELAEAHAQREQLESQLAALQQQLEQQQRQQQHEQDGLLGEALGATFGAPDAAEAVGLGGRSPALPATPTAAAISNPVFSPDREVAELHQQARQGGRGMLSAKGMNRAVPMSSVDPPPVANLCAA